MDLSKERNVLVGGKEIRSVFSVFPLDLKKDRNQSQHMPFIFSKNLNGTVGGSEENKNAMCRQMLVARVVSEKR